jgi:hypothetical protein
VPRVSAWAYRLVVLILMLMPQTQLRMTRGLMPLCCWCVQACRWRCSGLVLDSLCVCVSHFVFTEPSLPHNTPDNVIKTTEIAIEFLQTFHCENNSSVLPQ